MEEKINCPKHVDKTPSLVLYADGFAHCFSCGWHPPIEEIPGFEKAKRKPKVREKKYVEDIEQSIKHIESLPKSSIRGLLLNADRDSYYIVFPDHSYYKRRFTNPMEGKGRYCNPIGCRRPKFILPGTVPKKLLVFVEGEINALSIKEVCPEISVASPGSATDFYSKHAEEYREYAQQFDRVVIITDKDAAGARAALGLMRVLWPKKVELQLWSKDSNELLQEGTLKQHLDSALGLSGKTAV